MNEAKKSGADFILIIKFNYNIDPEKNGFKLSTKEISYNYFSLNTMKSLKNATKNISITRIIDTQAKKNKILKKLGTDIYTN